MTNVNVRTHTCIDVDIYTYGKHRNMENWRLYFWKMAGISPTVLMPEHIATHTKHSYVPASATARPWATGSGRAMPTQSVNVIPAPSPACKRSSDRLGYRTRTAWPRGSRRLQLIAARSCRTRTCSAGRAQSRQGADHIACDIHARNRPLGIRPVRVRARR